MVGPTSRSPNAEIPITGTIGGLTGSAAAFEFTIEGRLIRGDAATQFFGDGNRADSFTNLRNGGRAGSEDAGARRFLLRRTHSRRQRSR